MKLPYYVTFFQGKDFIINCKVDQIKESNEPNIGFVETVWLKFKDLEWEADLALKKINYNSDECLNFFSDRVFACDNESHIKYDFNFFSICLISNPAISFWLTASIPSKPGDELTSKTKGPLDELIISTPATSRLRALHALVAIDFIFEVIVTFSAKPPK